MPNQLIHETSPYLLQHADNPVNWYPWGPEALRKAREENKPIFLSIGYAACHWCHVMEHESFEDPQTAQLMNEHFISIKVDREERPDLDGVYMNAVVAMTGQGGWPLSVFLTPDGKPFFGGTYFPSERRYGMPSFREVLAAIARSWSSETDEIQRVSGEVIKHLQQNNDWNAQAGGSLRQETLQTAAQALLRSYDWDLGGWGKAPRFPQPMAVEFLLLQAARGNTKALEAASHALRMMSRGGMYDVVGGGFHRYSTDDFWLVPHFEKMLYDNAQLALVYLHAHLMTGSAAFRQVCIETLDFVLREMTDPQGGFYSSLDADSEGVEGKFYIWTPEEIDSALTSPDERELLHRVYPITSQGNFEGMNILQRQGDLDTLAEQMNQSEAGLIQRLDTLHQRLYQARAQRVRPLTDDKVLVAWNGLALRAFAQAARYLNRPDYLQAAQKNASFILEAMQADGKLQRAWRDGKARHNAYLEDYAALILALLDLYQSDPDSRWYAAAERLAGEMLAHFRDPQGGFFDTRDDQETLITRPKDVQDNATPSGNALAAGALLHLSAYDERPDWHGIAENMLITMQDMSLRYPTAFGLWLQDMDFAIGPVRQIAVIGKQNQEGTQALLEEIWREFRPRTVVALSTEKTGAGPALLYDRGLLQGKPTAYVCLGFTCNLPVNTVEGLQQQLS